MKYNAVIFDLDGTLLDTIEDLLDNLNAAFAALNLRGNFIQSEMETFLGSGKKVQIERALVSRGYPLSLYEKVDEALSVRYINNAENKTAPYQGIIELLKELKTLGIKAICLTNKPHDVAIKVVKTYFNDLILATYGVKPHSPVKPDRILVENTLKLHGLNANEVLYVGDSDVDMMTANNGNLDSCFVKWGYVRLSEVMKYHPKYIVSFPLEILDIVRRKNA